jgi:hypothetical protein
MMTTAHGRQNYPQVNPPEPQPPVEPNPPAVVPEFPVAKAEKPRSTRFDAQAGHFSFRFSSSVFESSSSKTWPHFLQLNSNKGTEKPPVTAGLPQEASLPARGGFRRFLPFFLQFVPVTDRATGRASAGLQAQLGKNELNDDEVQHHEYDELFHVGPSGPFSR